jgi:GNAT superfamily N-acetyltransferase
MSGSIAWSTSTTASARRWRRSSATSSWASRGYSRNAQTSTADVAVLVEDGWQRKGLAVVLIERLRELARSRGIETFTATILSENRPAIRMVRKVFPGAVLTLDGPELTALMPFDPR